jgi:hypothetical protein
MTTRAVALIVALAHTPIGLAQLDRLCPPAADYVTVVPTGAVLDPDGCFDTSAATSLSSLFADSIIPGGVDVSLLTPSPRYTYTGFMFVRAVHSPGRAARRQQ